MSGLPLQMRADRVEVKYRHARKRHDPSRAIWIELFHLRTRDLERGNRTKKAAHAKQLPLFRRAA